MNTHTITLSSNNTSYTSVSPTVNVDDHTTLYFNVENVLSDVIPIYLKVDWGDGTSKIYDNDIPQNTRENINLFSYSNLLDSTYSHEYYPSNTSLYKNLTAQLLVYFSNGDYSWFIVPLSIRSYDYFESIYDLSLKNTNIRPDENNGKQHQFISAKDRFTLELSD